VTAPVYRNIDSATTFLGLSFPLETVLVFAAWFACLALLSAGKALLGIGATYLCVRLVGHGKPAGFVQHWLNWWLRRLLSDGCLSAQARAPAPRFPFEPYRMAKPRPQALSGRRTTLHAPEGA
jgi:hypothetical protein